MSDQPFITLHVTNGNREGNVLLHVEFQEASYDHTCIAVQTLVTAFMPMMAGDEVFVSLAHWRDEYSAEWHGTMPRFEKESDTWRDFLLEMYRATR